MILIGTMSELASHSLPCGHKLMHVLFGGVCDAQLISFAYRLGI